MRDDCNLIHGYHEKRLEKLEEIITNHLPHLVTDVWWLKRIGIGILIAVIASVIVSALT